MEVVLREDVDSLGLRGDVVNVARGYARNFLLPRGLAEIATPALQKELEKRDAQRARHEAKTEDEAQAIAQRLSTTELRFDVTAGPTGSLFGSVTATNVVDRLWDEMKIRVDRRKLGLQTIKKVGRYTVPIEVFGGVTADLKLVVAPPGEEPPSEEEQAAVEAAEAAEVAAAEAEAKAEAKAAEVAVQEVVEAEEIEAEEGAAEDAGAEAGETAPEDDDAVEDAPAESAADEQPDEDGGDAEDSEDSEEPSEPDSPETV